MNAPPINNMIDAVTLMYFILLNIFLPCFQYKVFIFV